MLPKKLEEFSDRSLERLDSVADQHMNGNMEDKTAHVQASVANATSRAINTNINTRRLAVKEALVTA